MTQLHDKNKTISSEALDILDEACEDKVKVYYFMIKYLGMNFYSIILIIQLILIIKILNFNRKLCEIIMYLI